MSEVNFNYVEIDNIRESTDHAKIEFISNVISSTDFPAEFKARSNARSNSNAEKKKFEIKNGEQQKREWVLFVNNKFYCIYCLCFSSLNKNRFVNGVEYVKNYRIVDKLCTHGKESNHKIAMDHYSRMVANYEEGERAYQSGKRNAVKCIVKIIIYIATHGLYCDTIECKKNIS